MPSPIGHVLAGLTVGWVSDPAPARTVARALRDALTPFAVWCALVAALPDADLLLPHFHRTATHSVTATVVIFIMAAAMTGKVTGSRGWRFAIAVALAHTTHLLLDWLGMDRFPPPGIQLFWPFSDRFFISGLDVFPPVERRLLRPEAIAINGRAAFWELTILGPIAVSAWAVRWRRRKIERLTMTRSEAR